MNKVAQESKAAAKPPARHGRTRVKTVAPPQIVVEHEEWYANYPRQVGKAASLSAYRRVRRGSPTQRPVSKGALLQAVRMQHLAFTPAHLPAPAVWLDQRRWETAEWRKREGEFDFSFRRKPANDIERAAVQPYYEDTPPPEPEDPPETSQAFNGMVDLPALEPWVKTLVAAASWGDDVPLVGKAERLELFGLWRQWQDLMTRPIDDDQLVMWLHPLAWAMEPSPTRTQFMNRVEGVMAAAPNLPMGVLCQEVHIAAVRAFAQWPSTHALIELLEDHAARMAPVPKALWKLSKHYTLDDLRGRIAAPLPPPSVKAIAAVERLLNPLRQRQAELSAPAASRPVKPAHVSREVLEQIRGAAALRAQQLQAQTKKVS
jgi:hypothetical protein